MGVPNYLKYLFGLLFVFIPSLQGMKKSEPISSLGCFFFQNISEIEIRLLKINKSCPMRGSGFALH